jgi:hypothetical protein
VTGIRGLSIEVGTRAALAIAVPLVVLTVLGRLDLAAYATFGAFTALYGRNEPYRLRLRSVSIAAVGLLVSIGLGIVVASTGAPLWITVVALLLITTGGTLVGAVFGLLPAQPLFFVFAFLVCGQIPTPPGEALSRWLLAIAVAAFAWLLTMSGWVVRRARPGTDAALLKELRRRPSVDRSAVRDERVWLTVAQNAIGVVVTGGIALAFGLGHPYWSVVSLVAVLPPARGAHSISRSIHRIIGTIVGVGVAEVVLLPSPPPVVIVIVVVVCQFFAEILVGRHYGAALVFVTPLALSVSYLAAPVPVLALASDRVIETLLGAVVGIVLVLIAQAVASRRPLPGAGPSGA